MDSDEDVYKKRLSEVVSDILKCEGFFMEHVEVFRSECLLSEKIKKDLFGVTMIKCGSVIAEGSNILGSDIDHMIVYPGIVAVNGNFTCNLNLSDLKINILTMALDNCLPGYTRLLVNKLNPKSIFTPEIQLMIEKEGNSLFLSSKEFLKKSKNFCIKSFVCSYGNVSYTFHGPCTKYLIYNLKDAYENFEYDMTRGIECLSWPVAAKEWIYRRRLMGWPSKEIVKKIASFPVHVMPVGDSKSNISSMQWRFAFSKAERELIWNFNDFQFQCYVLLKSIFKSKLKLFSPNEMSGYQMKMLIFWISEEYGVKIFTKGNLLHCVEICFERFKKQILNSFLPHYFFHDRNLLAGKLEIQTRQQIADEIDKILEDIFVTIIECQHILLRHSSYMLKLYKGSKRHFLCHVMMPLIFGLMQCPKIVKLKTFQDSFKVCSEMLYLPNNFEKLTEFVGDIDSGKNCYSKNLPYMLKTAKMFGLIQLGLMFYEDSFNNKTPEEKDILFHKAKLAFHRGMDLDEFSGKLYLITFILLKGKIDTALSILVPIMYNTKPFVHSGLCSTRYLQVLQFSNTKILYSDYFEDNEEVSNCFDMSFPKNVVHFVPEPIKYELFLQQCTRQWEVCLYHPVVYAFYLMFEMTRKKGGKNMVQNDILNKLSTFIEDCKGGLERHRAYNLLGFCYYKCGQIDEAVAVYCRSLQEKSDNTNVAVYHLCIILLEHITSKTSVLYSRT